MISRSRNPARYYRKRTEAAEAVDALYVKMYVKKLPFEAADWAAAQELRQNEFVRDSWELTDKLDDLERIQKAKDLLGRVTVKELFKEEAQA